MKACYNRLGRLLDHLQSPLLLAMRLYWGWQFFITGRGKFGRMEEVAGFFQNLHIPFPFVSATLAATTECFGGLLLMVGLASRLVSIPLAFTMVVAYATAHREALVNLLSDPDTWMKQPPFLFLLTVLIVMAFGPGAFSLDGLIAKLTRRRTTNS